MCRRFSIEMQKEFEMSMIGELKFFLVLQVIQNDTGIFISQSVCQRTIEEVWAGEFQTGIYTYDYQMQAN